ncbi:alpha/beta-hydrolase N-terminal domain-containing protein [Corynebacterium pilosum]|uniref:alpha/beta-hydrolase N-terminal domain-containing protein n=1 Tax=Corynebacterium pilosum TaxID=35756 RepID=UPI000653919B|nr:alpha/beta-hydrolase N-terminal domain-containing protein [Corynebacterium pilosum]
MARLHPWGLVFAAIFFTIGLTPSLLLRDWFYQGVVSGLAAGCGYGVGVAVHWLVVRLARWRPIVIPQRRRTVIDAVVATVVVLWMIITTVLSISWQGDLAELTGVDIQPLC